jgi:hypothetical protein
LNDKKETVVESGTTYGNVLKALTELWVVGYFQSLTQPHK